MPRWFENAVFGATLFCASAAAAQIPPPPPCPDDSIVQFEGQTGSTGPNGIPFDINLAPCQKLEISIEAAPTNPLYGAYVQGRVFNNAGQSLFMDHRSTSTPVTLRLPPPYEPWIPRPVPEYYGVRGDPGLPVRGMFRVDVVWPNDKVNYKFVMRKTRRRPPGDPDRVYNEGGTSFGNAALVPLGTHYYGALSIMEVPSAVLTKDGGQYFKVRLEPGEAMYFKGDLLAEGGLYSPGVDIYIWDPGQAEPVRWWYFVVDCPGPSGESCVMNFDTSSQPFANPHQAPTEFYVSIRSRWEYLHAFKLGFYRYAKKLTLFLDVNGDFEQNHLDDAPIYVPGSQLNGVSVPLVADGDILQQVRLIAAFVNDSNQIIAPPSGVTQIEFALDKTSAFTGQAMNWGANVYPDFILADTITTFTNNLAIARLNAFDYGGFTNARASILGGYETTAIRVPRDANDNWLPDAGWWTPRGLDPMWHVDDTGQAKDADADDRWKDFSQTPAPAGNPTQGVAGDGLAMYHEYRGFVAGGNHYRTNPETKDLFVASYVVWNNLDHGLGFAFDLPLVVFPIWGEDYTSTPEYRSSDRVINFNRGNGGHGGPIPGDDQKGLRAYTASSTTTYGATLQDCVAGLGGGTPNETSWIRIYADYHFHVGQQLGDSEAQIRNEIDRTIGHEVGHGVHLDHRNDSNDPPCTDYFPIGLAPSVMNSDWFHGPPATDPRSRYNDPDKQQIRVHIRF